MWPMMWLGLAVAAEADRNVADAELIEFLGSFETKTGTWPELAELLAPRPAPPASSPPPPAKPTERPKQ